MSHTPPYRSSSMSIVFSSLIFISVLYAALFGTVGSITTASFEGAKQAVTLALGLIGVMALWLGFVKILEDAGVMKSLAKAVEPFFSKLFPSIPSGHPAMSAMMMNISANMLGLGNAATPLGIKAMEELSKINQKKEEASDDMCLFLAINTSSVTILPLGVIGLRAAAGCDAPASIVIPSILATTTSTIIAIAYCKFITRKNDKLTPNASSGTCLTDITEREEPVVNQAGTFKEKLFKKLIIYSVVLFLGIALASLFSGRYQKDFMSEWLMPGLMLIIVATGLLKKVKIYESITEGAKQGFDVAVRIIPFLVVILSAVAMFQASGALALLVSVISPISSLVGMPAEALPLALIRPLSGSGAFAILSSIVNQDPNSYTSYCASIMMGSTETTFYVLAIYFGSVGITGYRHALMAGLIADFAGMISASIYSKIFWNMLHQ
jgi:spore maturation protein SpmA